MVGTILKTIAYTKAPKTTFMVLHPAKAVSLRKMKWDLRHAYATRVTAIGVAAMAIPLGMWLGRRGGTKSETSC
jgi:hypothetical protein